jgi:exodeoxyribonuclease-3
MKGYNGVAILSKHPLSNLHIWPRTGRHDCRHISAAITLPGLNMQAELHCIYIPAGGDEPDPVANEKFAHKLAFIDELAEWFKTRYTPDKPMIALGDLNTAPLENDVWSHKQLLKVISHTPIETEKHTRMQHALNWIDVTRHFVPEDQKAYTWWSYRNRDWKKSNRGRRLDHIWVTKPLEPYLQDHQILQDVRDWEKTSDHVPVMVTLSKLPEKQKLC